MRSTNKKPPQTHASTEPEGVRLDKWLWAARFYKVRALSKHAIETGRVHYAGQRTKCSRQVELGAEITLRQGFATKTVVVTGLSETRRGAPEAAQLYAETSASKAQREEQTQARKAMGGAMAGMQAPKKPSKKERRAQAQFLDQV